MFDFMSIIKELIYSFIPVLLAGIETLLYDLIDGIFDSIPT